MTKSLFRHTYEDIISLENLLEAWQEFVKGKRSRPDVQHFEHSLMENIFQLHESLVAMTYAHSPYTAFTISDPKSRQIHKASVADRVLHRALYRKLYPFFDRLFIADSFSCRMGKGTHRALDRFHTLSRRVTRNQRETGWVLKCDIKKFFASIDQRVLLNIFDLHILDKRIVHLLACILESFSSSQKGVGLPLGNLTSQLFSNVYMNTFDQYVKQNLRQKYYIRYADDFVFFATDKLYLQCLLPLIEDFISRQLHLHLHPKKVFIKTVASGVDFLGWIHFPTHRVLRTTTRRRMLKALDRDPSNATITSFKGLLKHGATNKLRTLIDSKIESTSPILYPSV